MNYSNNYTHIFFLSDNYTISHRRDFVDALHLSTKGWSNFVVVSAPVSVIFHSLVNIGKIIRLLKGNYKTYESDDGKIIFTPIILFHYIYWLKFGIFAKVDKWLIVKQLKRLSKKYQLSLNNNILYVFYPYLYPLVKNKFFKTRIYEYYDNHSYDYDGNIMQRMDLYNKELMKESDIVICTAKILFEQSRKLNVNSFYLPNGNDFKLLSSKSNTEIVPDLEIMNIPIIGYIGMIRNWIDFELLKYLMKSLPDVLFVFIGRIDKNAKDLIKEIESFPNYRRYGFMVRDQLINYMAYFKVGLIPFRVNKFTEGVYPLKFNEYIAAQIPVVTTALPDLEEYSDYIGYSRTYEDFLKFCKEGIKGEFGTKVKHYKDIAFNNSWDKKAESLNRILINHLSINTNPNYNNG